MQFSHDSPRRGRLLTLCLCGLAGAACANSENAAGGAPPPTARADGSAAVHADSGGPKGTPPARTTSAWPQLGAGNSSHFRNPNETVLSVANVASLKQSWEFKVAGSVTGAPAVVGGTVYVAASSSVYALDVKPSAGGNQPVVKWESQDVGTSSSPTYADGVLYVNGSTSAGGETLVALDAATGKAKWSSAVSTNKFATGLSSPVVADKYVIVGDSSFEELSSKSDATFRGAVVAFDRVDGHQVWRFDTVAPPDTGCSVWSTVSIDLDARVVFASTGNNYTENPEAPAVPKGGPTSDSVFALALDTGKELWHRQASKGDVFTVGNARSPDSDFGTNPILFDAPAQGGLRKLVGLGQKSGDFWALDRGTGDVVWQRKLGPGSQLGGVLNNGAYDGARILVASTGATSTAPGSEPSTEPGGLNGALGITTATLFALDPATGDILWERQLPAAVWAPITVANGVGFVAADQVLEGFDVTSGAKLFAYKAVGTIASAPAIVDGRVFFGSGMTFTPQAGIVLGHGDDKLHVLAVAGAP
jgi:polyvinyl alcohol dehydrogenase (cytochrome)